MRDAIQQFTSRTRFRSFDFATRWSNASQPERDELETIECFDFDFNRFIKGKTPNSDKLASLYYSKLPV